MDQPDAPRTRNVPARYDLSRPENQAKLEIVEQLAALADDAGLPLPHMALAFAQNHPAVTSVITGPRTMEQLEGTLAALDVTLTVDVLDRIDEIVPPGSVFNRADAGYEPPEILDARLRRRA
jgi:aryl-alcohol dehydrogenase-like predicted oxidoreductase